MNSSALSNSLKSGCCTDASISLYTSRKLLSRFLRSLKLVSFATLSARIKSIHNSLIDAKFAFAFSMKSSRSFSFSFDADIIALYSSISCPTLLDTVSNNSVDFFMILSIGASDMLIFPSSDMKVLVDPGNVLNSLINDLLDVTIDFKTFNKSLI